MSPPAPVFIDRDGVVAATYQPEFLPVVSANLLLDALVARRSAFKNGFMLVGDLWVKTPRLVAEFGDDTHIYPDTGPNRDWFDEVRALRDRTEQALGQRFNYAIVNWYRNGRDFTGWHTDKMQFHAPDSAIAMIGVGATRRFEFRETDTGQPISSSDMGHGDLLLMLAPSQRGYEHSLRQDESVPGLRISITLRNLLPTREYQCPMCSAADGAVPARRM